MESIAANSVDTICTVVIAVGTVVIAAATVITLYMKFFHNKFRAYLQKKRLVRLQKKSVTGTPPVRIPRGLQCLQGHLGRMNKVVKGYGPILIKMCAISLFSISIIGSVSLATENNSLYQQELLSHVQYIAVKMGETSDFLAHKEKIHITVNSKSQKKQFQYAMETARINGYLFLPRHGGHALTSYLLVPRWMDEKGEPLLLTEDERFTIQTRVEKEFSQDLVKLTFDNLIGITQKGEATYLFRVQPEMTKLTFHEKLGIIAVYTNTLKIKYEETISDRPQ